MRRHPRIAAFALAALLLSGCGQDNTAAIAADAAGTDTTGTDTTGASNVATPATLPRACTLVTESEAQTVVGQPVGLMVDEPENCMWASSGAPGRITMFMVQTVRGADAAETRSLYASLTGLNGDLNATINDTTGAQTRASGVAVADLGDDAWLTGSNADLVGTRQLIVRKGLVVLVLNITGMNSRDAGEGFDARMQAAARTALARMGA